ncbi:MAG: shikimate kinase [Firmicutes bacterium]|jgi:shikimate kinase|nr:shikimate kinase [Bacillota bacterium]MCL5014764.1 shikimate kinase [Bacillota bacterium]
MSGNINGHLVITGMMGSGKSTVGPKLAAVLSRPFYDLDDEIVSTTGMAIPEIFERYGEQVFRKWELEKLDYMLSRPVPQVLALGGGTLADERAFALLRGHCVIWLEGSTEELWQRVRSSGRPLVQRGLEAFRRMHEERRTAYTKAATFQFDCSQEPDVIVRMIVQTLGADGDE